MIDVDTRRRLLVLFYVCMMLLFPSIRFRLSRAPGAVRSLSGLAPGRLRAVE